jgi:hypothetical protein
MNPAALRSAIFTKLNVTGLTGLLASGYSLPAVFHEAAPQVDDSGSAAHFPYVSFWQVTDIGFNTDDHNGTSAIVQVDIWSRLNNSQCEAIAKVVYGLLHRQALVFAGWINTECESIEFQRDPDGKTRHGILRFRVLSLPQ